MADAKPEQVLVQVITVEEGREIGWGSNVAEELEARLDDIRRAIASSATAVASSLKGLPAATDWRLGEVSASFGVTLAAEAGVIISKASAEATFDVTVSYTRQEASEAPHHGGRADPR